MDEKFDISEEQLERDFFKPRCPVAVGDRFYRKRGEGKLPDRIQVIAIDPIDEGYIIHGYYIYHGGENANRSFSSSIFKNEDWVIEKKGIDF